MTTVYRHTLYDSSVEVEVVARLQVQAMKDEAVLSGQQLTDIEQFWNGTLADAKQSPEAAEHLPDHLAGYDDTLNILIHQGEVTA